MKIAGDTSLTHVSTAASRDLPRLREVAGEVVGSVFFGTLLKAMRESGLKGEYGHGGRGEAIFAERLHRIIAERMGAAGRYGLGDVLYDRFQRQQRLARTDGAVLREVIG